MDKLIEIIKAPFMLLQTIVKGIIDSDIIDFNMVIILGIIGLLGLLFRKGNRK